MNLVFFKIVRSRTKFWQMLGRGTRRCPDLFGPGRHKAFFSVFGFWQNSEFFNQHPETAEGSPGASLSERLFLSRLELIAALDQAAGPALAPAAAGPGSAEEGTPFEGPPGLRDEVADLLHAQVSAMSLDNVLVRPHRLLVETYGRREAWARLGLDEQAEVRGLAALPSGVVDNDLADKQFDAVILRAQLAVLRADAGLAAPSPVLRQRFRVRSLTVSRSATSFGASRRGAPGEAASAASVLLFHDHAQHTWLGVEQVGQVGASVT